MILSGDPTPYDFPVFFLLLIVAVVLLGGAIWLPKSAAMVRRGGLAIAVGAFSLVLSLTPTHNGIVGAGRLLTLEPVLGLVVFSYLVWAWRARRF